jgi:peptidyl-prolyl cis-trans isomerase D
LKLQEYVISLAHATDPEVKLLFNSAEDKRKVRYVEVPIQPYAQRVGVVDSSDVEQYYEEHREDFHQGRMAELDYVTFPKVPSAEDTSVVFNELLDLRRQILDGADFNELAKTYSEEPNALQTGGDLGWFGRGRMVAPFDSAVFSMNVGDVSEPVATRFGYHLIKLQEKRRVNDSDQVHASHILLKVEISGRTMSDLHLKAQNFMDGLEHASMDSLASEYGVRMLNTGKFAEGSSIRGIGRDRNVEEFAFNGKPGDISNVFDLDRFFAVFKIKAHYPEGYQPLADVRGRIVMAIKNEMGADSARAEINKIENEIKAGKTLSDAAKTYDHKVVESDFFGRFDNPPGIPSDPAFHGIAFSLTKEHPISAAFKAGMGFYILELMDEQPPNLENYAAERDSLYNVVLNSKRNQIYQSWYDNLYQQANVQDYRYQVVGGY